MTISKSQKFKNALGQRFFAATNLRKSTNPERHFRRLDSLARLLEGASICSAVYFNELNNRLWVATNKIHKNSRKENNYTKKIKDVFSLLTNTKLDNKQLIFQLSKLIYDNFAQEHRWEIGKLEKNNIDIVATINDWLENFMSNEQPSKIWLTHFLRDLECDAEVKIPLTHCINKIARLMRDFLKLRKFLHENHSENNLANAIATALREQKYQILHVESNDVHAEMRIIGKLLATPNAEKSYVGVSKLCCAHCALAVKAFKIRTRGLHGQTARKWQFPHFIKAKPENLKAFFGKTTHTLFASLTEDEQAAALVYTEKNESCPNRGSKNRNTNADWSESDEEDLATQELEQGFTKLKL